MQNRLGILGGFGLGAGLVYLLDPDKGKRRRAIARDKAVRLWHAAGKAVDKRSRDWSNRARGVVAEARAKAGREEVSDDVLVDRVRSEIGHAVSAPGAIQVSASQGRITLVGSVHKRELESLLARAASLRGVTEVQNRLSIREVTQEESAQPKRTWLKPVLWSLAGSALALYGGRKPAARRQVMKIWSHVRA